MSLFSDALQSVQDFLYNAATGKLSDAQKADIVAQNKIDLWYASGQNTDVYTKAADQMQASVAQSFAESDAAADSSWQTKLIGWVELALVVFIVFYVIGIFGKAREGLRGL